MFFLNALPTRQMVEGYTDAVGTGDPDTILSALNLMRSASLLIRKVERHFSAHDLSQLKFLILVVIDRERDDAGLRHADVAARIDVSKPVLSRTIRALVNEGLLTETPDPEDGRGYRLLTTPDARERLLSALPGYYRIIQDHMSGSDAFDDRGAWTGKEATAS